MSAPMEQLSGSLSADAPSVREAAVSVARRAGSTDVLATDDGARERAKKATGLLDVSWRSCGPYRADESTVEFALNTTCGAAMRFRIDKASAAHFHATLGEALYGEPGVQSEMSSGMPSPSGEPIRTAARQVG